VNNNNTTYDIAIIGAGPAGCAAALGLGKSGYHVALIDKDTFPREKICGDAIPGPAIKALESTFPFFKQEFEKLEYKQRVRSSRIMLNNGRSIDYNWALPAFNIKRSIFDDFLLRLVQKYADVQIISNYKVEKIITGQESLIKSAETSKEITVKLIIDCSGVSSTSRKPETGEPKSVFAIRAYFKGIKLEENTNYFWVDKKFLPGYFWVFPLPGGEFNVGFGIMTGKDGKTKHNPIEALENFMHSKQTDQCFSNAVRLSEIRGSSIPVGGEKNTYCDTGLLLAGDAASLADPLQGHGIDKAVVSGMLAARQAMRCFEANDFSHKYISEYDHLLQAGMERELRKNRKRMKLLSAAPFLLDLYSYFK